jgi:hypothetical protein
VRACARINRDVIYIYIYIHTHTHTHTRARTYTHTHTHTRARRPLILFFVLIAFFLNTLLFYILKQNLSSPLANAAVRFRNQAPAVLRKHKALRRENSHCTSFCSLFCFILFSSHTLIHPHSYTALEFKNGTRINILLCSK